MDDIGAILNYTNETRILKYDQLYFGTLMELLFISQDLYMCGRGALYTADIKKQMVCAIISDTGDTVIDMIVLPRTVQCKPRRLQDGLQKRFTQSRKHASLL